MTPPLGATDATTTNATRVASVAHGCVLVLDGDSAAAMAAVQRLGQLGVHVSVAAEESSALAFQSRYAAMRHRQPTDEEDFAAWLTRVDDVEQPELVIPSTERSLALIRDHPVGSKAELPPDESLDIALDKAATLAQASELGIPIPKTRLVDKGSSPPRSHELPVVLKPVRSQVSIGKAVVTPGAFVVREVRQWHDVVDWLCPHVSLVEQEHVPGRGVGINLLYRDGRCVRAFAHRRLHEVPLTGGSSTYRESIAPPPTLLQQSITLLSSLRWHGPAMVEWRVQEHEPARLMEINPRLWGSLPLTIAAGVDVPGDLLRISRGEPLGAQPPYRAGLRMRRIPSDLGWIRDNFRARRSKDRDDLLLTEGRLRSFVDLGRLFIGADGIDHLHWHDRTAMRSIAKNVVGAVRRQRSRR